MILAILLLIAQVIFIVSILFKFYEIYNLNKERKKSEKIREGFNEYLEYRKKYAEEINNPSLRREFMMETAKFLENILQDMTILNNFNYDEKMEEMTLKWKEHIPELKQKFRQDQLNKLV